MDPFLLAGFFLLITFIFLFLTFFVLIFGYWTAIFGAGLNISPTKKVKKALKLAKLKEGEILYDLGCGNGKVLIIGAKEFGAKGVGIEISPFLYLWAKFNIWHLGLSDKIKIYWGNFMNFNLKNADVIYLFLSKRANRKLAEKFRKELSKKTRVVSLFWKVPKLSLIGSDEKEKIWVYSTLFKK